MNEDITSGLSPTQLTDTQLCVLIVCICVLTLAVVKAVDGVVVGGGPRLVEGGACVAEGGVGRVTVVHTGVPGVGVVRFLNLHWNTHTQTHNFVTCENNQLPSL